MDAQISYAFHSERKLHPDKFKNLLINQSTYTKLGCTLEWFLASLFHPSSRNIAQLARVKIMTKQGHWQDLHVPHYIRSIVGLHLPSFSCSLNPRGTPNSKKRRDKGLDTALPYVDDDMLLVVGFRDAWHGLVLRAPPGHGTLHRTAHWIRFEFHKGAADPTFMRIDGEPCKKPLPVDDDTMVVEISHLGQEKCSRRTTAVQRVFTIGPRLIIMTPGKMTAIPSQWWKGRTGGNSGPPIPSKYPTKSTSVVSVESVSRVLLILLLVLSTISKLVVRCFKQCTESTHFF